MTNSQWAILEPLVPKPSTEGRLPLLEQQEIVNAILYMLRSGCLPISKPSKLLKNYLVPGLGKIYLHNLTPQQVQAFYSKKIRDGLSPKTVNNIHALLHKVLDNAVKWTFPVMYAMQ